MTTGELTPSTTGASAFPEVDAALRDLAQGEAAWARASLGDRADLLDRVAALTASKAQEWVDAAARFKKLPAASALLGEEWLSGPYSVVTACHVLAQSLRQLAVGKSPLADARIGSGPGGRTTVQVLPSNIFDTLLLNGFSAEVWLEPGVDADTARRDAGLAQRNPTETGGIGAVLGAGNITSIAPLDTLYELIAHNRVVALKLNPVTDPMEPVLRAVFAPLVELGAVRILTGGPDVGSYLVHHDAVAHVHMTGSSITHDAIVFGTGEEGAERRKANTPLLDVPISSELGGVSPVIVIPGEWSDADIRFQAEHVVTQRLHNGGYNCVAAQVVVISSEWPQRDAFLAALRTALHEAPDREPYYPGSATRVAGARADYPGAESLGPSGGRTLVSDLDPDSYRALLTTEYFAPVLGVIEIPYTGQRFVDEAVRMSNEEFVGTLGVNVIAHPDTLSSLGAAVDEMLEDLRYGTIALNAWTGVGFLTAAATWGAFPGHTLDDVQSGIGVVHNALLIDRPERTIVRGPFRPAPRSILKGEFTLSPKPPWFVTNRTAAITAKRFTAFAAAPSWKALPAIFASALRG
ncbi:MULTISPECIES: aldehyde dehydrogenase family protein [Nocardiaceae]|uniref:Aldehyde dehydrogenase (NAD(P)+) n=1 Tax=Rhodococcoides corynebacterioides TaxID=53972 RepID=A0ABS2KNQ4_9NOCA|nr:MULTISPECIES: aldehyde dehydrogenase family protein [Rhodococcus]MBM7413597.1 aldehyde dehydrogenase (NAD(P)+) [Rhodococcus corynebacterioides]MBP1116060.1 aldehyde dehydrogenase (NAD(P)+) [Rhodococcus sp. PvP016]